MSCRRLPVCLLSWLAFSLALPVGANDHLLTIGGGPHAGSNQISLENNVHYLQRVLSRLRLNEIQQKILFSDGGDPQRDLQYEGERDPEDLRSLLADIVGPATGAKFDYRSSLLPIVDGTAEPTTIEETLKQYSAELANGDRLIVYFTGHGGRARGSAPQGGQGGPGGGFRGRRGSDNQRGAGDGRNFDGEDSRIDERDSVQDRSRTEDPEPTPVGAGDDQPTEEKVSEKPAVENAPTEKTSVENVPPEGEKSQNDNGGERPAGRGPGGRSSRREAFANNILHLWKRTDLSVTEWTEKLDKLPTDVPIIAVMVQCYSGGFGNFVFKGGNPANGLAGHARAGFFSTVPDRVAAGCTPKVNEAEYREYSSYFFEALCGESRTGQPVTSPDYDQDGQTSFLEAHAYTVLTADTIDIPVRTTDVYLRQVSTINGKEGLLTANSPITALLAYANPTERAVVEGLSQRFDLTGSDRGREVDDAIKAKRAEKQKVEDELRKHRQKVTDIKKEIGNVVKNRWPEISSHWHPGVARILTEEGETVRNTILEHPRYTELRKKEDEIKALSAESDQQELQVVKLERLKYWLETLALKANLTDNAKEAGLRRIGELESTFLTTKRAVAEIES